jgi:predicted nucleotide-binding protein (sugar kinase/HSP70/actin superfamily)
LNLYNERGVNDIPLPIKELCPDEVKTLKPQKRVGIPRALSYYTFFPLWKEFIEKLGFAVVVSNPTNRNILENGIKETVNDACIPIKVYHGHVLDLVGRVDYIFAPRMVSADGKSTFCPKFLGLPDMVRFIDEALPPLVDSRYNRSGLPGGLLRFFYAVAKALEIRNPLLISRAALSALNKQRSYQRLVQSGLKPPAALDAVFSRDEIIKGRAPAQPGLKQQEEDSVTVALLGYPYAVFDPYISAGIYQKLLKLGVEVITYEQIPRKTMRRFSKVMPQNFFWYYSNQVCWAGLHLIDVKTAVDGIIHITAFGCGPDAMVDKTLELEAKRAQLPFLSLAIDEHTGEGGVQTRVEAFVDMLKIKKSQARVG